MRTAGLATFVGLRAVLLAACETPYSPLEFDAEGEHFSVTGVIDESTPEIFRAITSQHPHIKTLVLQYVEGSVDDDANLEFSRDVRDLGFDTIVPSDGLIASGGTDLFLAGNRRTLESGACVGVHSWGGEGPPAAELPRDHHEHAKYLDYYRDLGVDLEFYWYTLAAAPAAEMHWMSADEADRFGLTTGQSPELGASIVCHGR